MHTRIPESISQSISAKQAILGDNDFLDRIEKAATLITNALREGHKILFCGNGGSAADAQHLAAVGNDYGYDQVFARLLRGTANQGDVLVGISTSGNSANILKAYDVCKEKGISIVSMTGASGGKMKDYSDLLLNVPSTDTPRIQESHIMIGHIICELAEDSYVDGWK
mgnify:CR=1 FL=1